MPKYLIEVNYTLDGVKGLKAEGGTARVTAATALIESVGGTVESFHFALGGRATPTSSSTCPTSSPPPRRP